LVANENALALISKTEMRIDVLFFGILKDVAGKSADSLVLPEGATLGDVSQHYATRIPKLRDLLPASAMSLNQEYAGPEMKLNENDEVAFLPPVSGGAAKAQIVREKIDSAAVGAAIRQPQDGATLMFDGIVRNNTRGRRTLYLEYESYEEMALSQMEALIQEALQKFAIRDASIVHRLGRLEIGQTSVLIVVASAHRGPAFDACRWLIDTLKRRVPIWKKEYFEDGAVWADGEPFPAEIAKAEGIPANPPASK